MGLIYKTIVIPHLFLKSERQRHHLRARATKGSVGGSDVEAEAEVER